MIRPLLLTALFCTPLLAAPALDERPPAPNEWGFRPSSGQPSETNPPGFVWRPQKDAASYEFECARDAAFTDVVISAKSIKYAVLCPPKTLASGQWHWRFRFIDKAGETSAWSQPRSFTIDDKAVAFPMPPREELLGRIPKSHPRLFVRPEQLDDLRKRAKSDLKAEYERLREQCEKLLKEPPDTAEPPKYPPGTQVKSEEWRKIWWGNREYTIKVLNASATLAFTRLLDGNEQYGQLAKRLLMDAAKWDVKGATNYHYNDEAGMPYVYFFARAYTFANDLLSEDDKTKCREVIRFRGNEMHAHLNPRHLWSPYSSHSNRAWHKLGEAGIAFLDEIPEAADWTMLAMNVFWNVYPVWSDADGGWHEGVSYWNSYISRFTYFADVMRVAMDVDAFKKPYFSRVGYYPMYLQPPNTVGGGFGDLVTEKTAAQNRTLMTTLAGQAKNPHWQWYVDQLGGAQKEGGYIGFVRGATPQVKAAPPTDLPTSRLFKGIGQAYLNTTLLDAKNNVSFGFKSSPMGTQSHGYDSNNSFFLYACGERLFAPTGRRDIYGSDHHQNWMWETKSCNSITVNGKGQIKHSASAFGEITTFNTTPTADYLIGEAAKSYAPGTLDRFARHVIFLKPDVFVIYDRLEAPQASTFEYFLHSPVEMKLDGQKVSVVSGAARCDTEILWPRDLKISVTDKYDVPPRDRIKVKEWHLKAQTTEPAKVMDFVTVMRIAKAGAEPVKVSHSGTASAFEITSDRGAGVKLRWHANRGEATVVLQEALQPK